MRIAEKLDIKDGIGLRLTCARCGSSVIGGRPHACPRDTVFSGVCAKHGKFSGYHWMPACPACAKENK